MKCLRVAAVLAVISTPLSAPTGAPLAERSNSVLVTNGVAQEGKALVAVPTYQASIYGDGGLLRGKRPLLKNLSLNTGLIDVIDRQSTSLTRNTLRYYPRSDLGSSTHWSGVTLAPSLENLLEEHCMDGSSDLSFVYQGERRGVTRTVRYAF